MISFTARPLLPGMYLSIHRMTQWTYWHVTRRYTCLSQLWRSQWHATLHSFAAQQVRSLWLRNNGAQATTRPSQNYYAQMCCCTRVKTLEGCEIFVKSWLLGKSCLSLDTALIRWLLLATRNWHCVMYRSHGVTACLVATLTNQNCMQ
jgi:hypothetical protein